MTPTIKFVNMAAWQHELRQFASLAKKPGAAVLRQQARLLVRDAAGLTPPTTKQPIADIANWPAQKAAGEKAVERDIRSGFKPARDDNILDRFKNPKSRADYLNYLSQGRYKAARTLLDRLRVKAALVVQPNSGLHKGLRDSRGRIRGKRAYVVLKEDKIEEFIKQKQALVGLAKSGWVLAGRKLGATFPGWIRRNKGTGIFEDKQSPNAQSIIVGNTVDYIQSAGSRLQVMERALKRRAESMRHQVEATMKRAFSGYGKRGTYKRS